MPLFAGASFDFGYPWWLSYGHLPLLGCGAALFALGYARKWPRWTMLLLGAFLLWAGAALLVERFLFDINHPPALPAQNFFRSGAGRVLDIGAGTGRSSIMVLEARPQATLVALDLFGESFDQHFGPGQSPQQRLLANLKAAGVEQRVSVSTADMRKLPFDAGAFDAVVTSYAMDHLNRKGSDQALAEAARVLKPGGDFLLMVIENDAWAKFAFGPLVAHGGTRGATWWTKHMQSAGFEILEQGTRPLTLYILARRLPPAGSVQP